MRIGGHADDLFNFCLKDDHGFHIRFTNPEDETFEDTTRGRARRIMNENQKNI